MNKICLLPKNIEELNLDVDSILIGLKHFNSLNTLEVELSLIDEILDKCKKDIIISINKVIHDSEIEELKNILSILSTKNIKGIIFDDISVYQLVKENNYNLNLIWGNIHQSTSYNTINTWYNFGVKNSITSPDITLNEIIDIKNNTKSKLFVPIYGMFEIFSSNRFLLNSYFEHIKKDMKDNLYFINNKIIDRNYPIYEDDNGTHIINGAVMNGLDEYIKLLENDIEYILINSYMVDNIKEVIDNFKTVRNMYENNEVNYIKIKSMSEQLGMDKVFLNKETIYKVKSDVNE